MKKQTNGSNLIFLHKFFKAVADSIIKVFIPLLVLKVTNNLYLSFAYLCFYFAFTTILNAILRKFIQKYGIIAIILHFLPIIIAEALLNFCEINLVLVVIVALLMALAQTLYSVPFNLVFLYGDSKGNVAKFEIATNVGKLIFIIVSGYLLSNSFSNSFLWLSIISSIVYILSVIPIMFSFKVLKTKYEVNKEISKTKPSKKPSIKFAIFHISFGCFQTTLDSCLPIYLYVNGLSFQAVTLLLAAIEICKIFANFLAKILIGKRKGMVCAVTSFVIFFSSLIGIIFIKNAIVLYILSCLCSIAFPLAFVPMLKIFCKDIRENASAFDDMTNRDISIFACRPLIYLVGFLGLGCYPCFVLGLIATTTMFVSEVKIIKEDEIKELKEEISSAAVSTSQIEDKYKTSIKK